MSFTLELNFPYPALPNIAGPMSSPASLLLCLQVRAMLHLTVVAMLCLVEHRRCGLTLHEDSSCRPGQGTSPDWWEVEDLCSAPLCLCVSEATDSVGSALTSGTSSPRLRIILALSPVSCLSKVPRKQNSRCKTKVSKISTRVE